MDDEYRREKRPADSYFEIQAAMGLTKHMGGKEATAALAESCRIDRDKYILEIGSGLGRTAVELARKYGCRVMGIDISEKMVEQAKKRAEKEGLQDLVEFRVGDARHLFCADSIFDAVIGESVLAFVEGKPGALREFIRVTKTGGYIGFNECTWIRQPPARLVEYITDVLGAVFMTPEGWREIWDNSGLEDVSARIREVHILEQWGFEMRELDFTEYAGAWSSFLALLFKSPETRQWAWKTLSMPRSIFSIFRYFGYGLYVGRK